MMLSVFHCKFKVILLIITKMDKLLLQTVETILHFLLQTYSQSYVYIILAKFLGTVQGLPIL